jgi:hypothetical protein
MRESEIIVLIVILAFIAYGISHGQYQLPTLSPKITIPDSRISALEARVKTLEEWAQRRGMKY